jgi:hypothetical protein
MIASPQAGHLASFPASSSLTESGFRHCEHANAITG